MEAIPLPFSFNLVLAESEIVPSIPSLAPAPARVRRDRSPVPRGPILPTPDTWYLPVKRVLETLLAGLLAILALPVIGLAALAVKLTSKGPAFYTQTRLGRGGRLFTIYKIRTMVHNCESLTGPRWSIPGDPRVTRVGWLLRVSHLDELPQLLNVLRGDMSLIGPRPERPEFLPELERAYPVYRQRLAVRPGVTGLAQVQLPADSDLEGVGKKLAHDLFYIRNISLWLDLRLLACTGLYVLGVPFRTGSRLLRLPGGDRVEQTLGEDLYPVETARLRRSA